MNPALVNLRVCYGPKSKEVGFEDLSKPDAPPQTDSYMPVHHDDLVNRVRVQLEASGLLILQESHVLWRGGQRYFGLMQVNHPDLTSAEFAMMVAIRNSYDKSLPAAIASGNQVFVCDNLVFNGEVVLGRKHTKNIFTDLAGLIEKGVDTLFKRWRTHFKRIEAYKAFGVSDAHAHDIIANAYLSGAISKVQLADAITQFHSPNHPEFKDRNMWSLHNAVTEVLKGRLDTLPRSSRLLHNQLDAVVGFGM